MFRRGFLASFGVFLTGLFPFKRPTKKVVFPDIVEVMLTCNHLGCGNRLRKHEHLVCDRHRGIANKRRYVIVHGGVFPTIDGDPCFYPVDHDPMSEDMPRHKKTVVFAKMEQYQEPFLQHPGIYPRYNSFPVLHTVSLGTIDELVAHYRKGLEAAAGRVDADKVATPESVKAQQDRFDAKYPRGEAHEIMPDYRGWKTFRDARIQYLNQHPRMPGLPLQHVDPIPPVH